MLDHSSKDHMLNVLRNAIGDPDACFRPGQWEAIDGLVHHRQRLLVVERTGWGKSLVYFMATSLLRTLGKGPTLIISPLLALMRNQCEAAARFGVRAVSFNSSNEQDWPALEQEIQQDQVDAILISPERLTNKDFVEMVLKPIAPTIGLLVVDEAHCISDWGHDFRPSYRNIVRIFDVLMDDISVLCTTATANERVVKDIHLQLGAMDIQRGPLRRNTLALQVLKLPSKKARLDWLAHHIPDMRGTGIVYTLTKSDADQIAEYLQSQDIHAAAYYSDVTGPEFEDSHQYREYLEWSLLNNQMKVLVATSALGMGYDKPDLGFVIHYQSTGSLLSYYQQVGRAGRAGIQADGIMLCGTEDADINQHFRKASIPREEWMDGILAMLARRGPCTDMQIEEDLGLRPEAATRALQFLQAESPSPIEQDGPYWRRSKTSYKFDPERHNVMQDWRAHEWREMQTYHRTSECLMQFLSVRLGDANAPLCGICANCTKPSYVSRLKHLFRRKTTQNNERF